MGTNRVIITHDEISKIKWEIAIDLGERSEIRSGFWIIEVGFEGFKE